MFEDDSHWPDCNWCAKAKAFSTPVDGKENRAEKKSFTAVAGEHIPKGDHKPRDSSSAVFLRHGQAMKDRITRYKHATTLLLNRSSELPSQDESEPLNNPQAHLEPFPMPVPLTTALQDRSASSGRTARLSRAATKTSKGTCTPSPASSMPASATWTTCPYITLDGQVNPDVRTLNGPVAITSVSQAVLYTAVSYGLTRLPDYSRRAAQWIDAFFLSSSTRMNPHMKFGQIVRGPGPSGQLGTYTGILDLRGLVKIINGILILKSSGSPDWTASRDQEMRAWTLRYIAWLENSSIAKMTASRANNHGSFYVSQLAVTKILAGDQQGAIDVLQHFFKSQFRDQLAGSGEQPFEAVRTRPFHYRCFNIEALITNAKIGDFLGLDLWSTRSKYGATIQTAVDYAIKTKPDDEDVHELVPHVASVAAAYGDPDGKYAAFMSKTMEDYESKPFWFYDQTQALPNSPAARKTKRRQDNVVFGPVIEFSCPMVFDKSDKVELDMGVYTTCNELRAFYEY